MPAPNPAADPTRRTILFTALLLSLGFVTRFAQLNRVAAKDDSVDPSDMNQGVPDVGKLNPQAPPELSRFAFLIGNWKCEAKLLQANGTWQKLDAAWQGRFILDGYAIQDEYRMTGPTGELIVLGMNIRSYDAANHRWSIKWLNALTGTWTDLASQEFGGVSFANNSVTYAFKESTAPHPYTRATYTNISKTHFTWKGEQSTDAKSWTEFMIVECHRTNP